MTSITPKSRPDGTATSAGEKQDTVDALLNISPEERRRESRKVILSSYLGSTIEFYDFLLYATAAAVVFPHVFFPASDPLAGSIAAFGTFAAGYVARPLGGALFGHFGDRLGRKKMLVLSMVLMGLASTAIGLIPSAEMIGIWGVVLLVIMRIFQGIAVGGEWGGAALMALEHSETKKRGFAASFTNAGAPSGAALGTFMMGAVSALLSEEQFLSWGWRIPFLVSFLLLIVGLIIRSKVSESPVFQAAMIKAEAEDKKKPKVPLISVLRRPKALLLTMFAGAAGFALQVLLPTFAVGYSAAGGTARSDVLYAFAWASVISIFMVVGSGRLSDALGRRPVMIAGLVLYVAFLFPMFPMLRSDSWLVILAAFTIALALHGMIYGPLAAFIAEQFGTESRYTGASLGYQLATLLGAGFTPTIVASLYAGPGGGESTLPVIMFIGAIAAVSTIAILLTRESKDHDLLIHEH